MSIFLRFVAISFLGSPRIPTQSSTGRLFSNPGLFLDGTWTGPSSLDGRSSGARVSLATSFSAFTDFLFYLVSRRPPIEGFCTDSSMSEKSTFSVFLGKISSLTQVSQHGVFIFANGSCQNVLKHNCCEEDNDFLSYSVFFLFPSID